MRNLRKRVPNGDRRGNTQVLSSIKAPNVLQTSSSLKLRPISFQPTRYKVRPRRPDPREQRRFHAFLAFVRDLGRFGADLGPGATHLGRSGPRSFVTPSNAQTSAVVTHTHTQTHLRGGGTGTSFSILIGLESRQSQR